MNIKIRTQSLFVWAVSFSFLLSVFLIDSAVYGVLIYAIFFFFVLKESEAISPAAIFTIFCFFYTVSFPILVLFLQEYQSSDEIILTIVRSGFILNLAFVIFSYGKEGKALSMPKQVLGAKYLTAIFFIFFVMNIISSFSGADKTSYQSSVSSVSALVYWFLCFLFLWLASTGKLSDKRNIFVFCFLFFIYYLFTGERDIFVKAALLVVVYLCYFEKLASRSVYLIYFLGIALLPISQMFKGILTYGLLDSSWDLYDVFRGEFLSQGRNFYWLIESSGSISYIFENMIWADFLRFLGLNENSSGYLFNRVFMSRGEAESGLGFTLIGEVFYTYGYVGLFLYGAITGFGLKKIYDSARNSFYYMFAYGVLIFTFSYALRADFANLLSGSVKLVLFPVLFAYVYSLSIKVLRKRLA